jgi:hypothetical protein
MFAHDKNIPGRVVELSAGFLSAKLQFNYGVIDLSPAGDSGNRCVRKQSLFLFVRGRAFSFSASLFFVTRMQTSKGDGGWVQEKLVASKACVVICVANGLHTGSSVKSRAVPDPVQTLRASSRKYVSVFTRFIRCTGVCDSEIRRISVRLSPAFGPWRGSVRFQARR